jgi:D-sedoheptulose 7-phosphate isomerase
MLKDLKKSIDASILIKKKLNSKKYVMIIKEVVNIIFEKIKENKKVFICGNGGSAADAQHLSAEFLVRLNPKKNRSPYPLITLTGDPTNITAIGNDFGFENLFKRNLEALGSKGDVLIVLTTSGNSKNILKVLKFAKTVNIFSIGFLGKNGGIAKKLADLNLIIPSNNVARIQEAHMFLGHFILNEVEKKLLKIK